MDAAKKYEYIKTLGEGSYGHVWLCRDRERDCLVAIKKFKDANKDSQAYHLAMREIKLLRATSHEHVVSVIEAFRSQSSGNVYLVMEYAESCLNLELKKHRTGLPTADVMRITWQLASALQYLHSRKIVHRDLKPANILLTAASDLKLCDFGFARDLPPAGQQADMSSYVTTRWYRAPEVVVGADYGAAVDIWALGCLFAELLNGQPLFPGASNMDQLALIVACFGHLPNRLLAKALTNPQLVGVQLRTGNPRNWAVALQQRFAPYGENAVTLLLSCLNPDPLKRATADEVLRSPYFEPIRQKKVLALNGPPTIAITVTTAAPASTTPPVTATAPAPAGPTHPAAAVPLPAVAAAAAGATDASGAAASSVSSKDILQAAPPPQQQTPAQPQSQQQPPGVVTPSADSARRASKEVEPQPERPAPAFTAHTAPTAPLPADSTGSAATNPEPSAVRPGPIHPALVAAPRHQATADVHMGRKRESDAGTGLGMGTGGMEVDTPPAAPTQPNAPQPQRQTTQVRFLPQTLPSFPQGQSQSHLLGQVAENHQQSAAGTRAAATPPGVGVALAAGAALDGAEAAKQLQQKDGRLPGSLSHLRASVAAIPMSSAAMGGRPMTDTGMGGQVTTQTSVTQGKAGATLVQHNKRASEHSIGMYCNHRAPGIAGGGGGPSDMPMRLARVSLVNPNIDVAQLAAAENASASSSPSTTPTGGTAPAAGAAALGNPTLISPANSLSFGAVGHLTNCLSSAAQYGAAGAGGRRRSTATGSRLTRVSHTCEGPEQPQRDEDSEDDRSSERLSLNGSQGGTSGGSHLPAALAPLGITVGNGTNPSPRRRHSRLAAVTEPGGQYPPGAMAAAGAAAAAAADSSSGYDHVSGLPNRGPSAPQMLGPLGRSTHQLVVHHHGANALSAGSGVGQGPTTILSDVGAHHTSTHGQLHSTMSAMSLNVLGIGAATREREREREREAVAAEAGGMLRSNAAVGIATPAAPTASQRSFTTQTASTSAAAAGLMSRPVSNLYINLEHHGAGISSVGSRVGPQEVVDANSGDSSSAVSPSTPTGAGGGASGVATSATAAAAASAAATAAAAVSAAPPNRRTTFTDGPGSMFKSVLRTLSTRRSATSQCGTAAEHQSAAAAASSAAAATATAPPPAPGLQAVHSMTGAPSHGSLGVICGAGPSQSSASSSGVSPFIPSRASSHNFITGAPAERAQTEITSSLSVPCADEYGGGNGAAAAALRRSITVAHGTTGTGLGVIGNARIGLPHLNVRIPEPGGGATVQSAVGNGYGSAVVSPAGRRRSQLAAQPTRTSDAGAVIGSAAAGLRQTSSGSMVIAPGHHQSCKPVTSLHGEVVAVPGLVGGGAGLPVVRNPAPPGEAPPGRHATGKGGRDVA